MKAAQQGRSCNLVSPYLAPKNQSERFAFIAEWYDPNAHCSGVTSFCFTP
ncbi:Nucleoside diphosphate kinase 7 [Apodemus speciosus]|uniref:Nucleoside diphosphate kinase 7 n=1 Tax=Apodemus speciosus TaxID=105296 RepID=A0ABQ0EEQ5_APOSI